MFSKPSLDSFTCHVCDKTFLRQENLNKHLLKHANVNFHHCLECGEAFPRYDSLLQHQFRKHQIGGKRKLENMDHTPMKKIKENPREFYELKKVAEKKMPKFSTTNTTYKVTTNNLEIKEIKQIYKVLKILFQSIIADITTFSEDNDLIRMAIQSPDLDFPIQLPFMKKSQLSAEHFLSEIERVLQSFEEFVLDGSFEIDIIHVKNPKGGRGPSHFIDLDSFVTNKKCIIRIQNSDNLCCARAIVTAKAKIDKHPLYENSIRRGRGIQARLAKELHDKSCIPLGVCGIEEIKRFQ